jgi:hypothetical protein
LLVLGVEVVVVVVLTPPCTAKVALPALAPLLESPG